MEVPGLVKPDVDQPDAVELVECMATTEEATPTHLHSLERAESCPADSVYTLSVDVSQLDCRDAGAEERIERTFQGFPTTGGRLDPEDFS
ncbi:hypothetical protein NDU88_006249 [Pleurodeles waltl]|uniref:Uncharacterized protein n=1 Tax=Pleurodeles waltl TaxID=8319 RepID=A0AAV7LNK6_PLEWA|nr:hypothetical protein NDU88_006249 [Pleurodeles waltl]